MRGRFDNVLFRGRIFRPLRTKVRLDTFIGRMHPSNGVSLRLRGTNTQGISSFSRMLLRCVGSGSNFAPLGSGASTRIVCRAFNMDGGAFGGTINSLCGGELIILRRKNVHLI